MAISNSKFKALILGDRVLTAQGMATVIDKTEVGSCILDSDSSQGFGYKFDLNENNIHTAFIGVPLSMIRPGVKFKLVKPQEVRNATILEVSLEGFIYKHDDDIIEFKWSEHEGNIASKKSVEERLTRLFIVDMKKIERVVHPIHGHSEAHPSMKTLSAGHRFNDGVHRNPQFYSVLFVSKERILVENHETKKQSILTPDELVNYFQSVQPGQMIPGATVHRKPGCSGMAVIQKIESRSDGYINYTEDSVIRNPDTISNSGCRLEQRKMYFYV